MKNAILLLGIFVTLFLAHAEIAESQTCPDTLAVHQELQPSIPGWQVFASDAPIHLAGVTFFDGPPNEKASLVYDETSRVAGKEIMTWRFIPNRDRPIWMACSYSQTSITVARRLSNEIRRCSVTYNPKIRVSGLLKIEKIDCN